MATDVLLSMRGIGKSFPGVQALTDVTLQVGRSKVMALMGENGAGKSTLMKILTGIHKQDSGSVEWNGSVVDFSSPMDSMKAGIAMVHQELNPIPEVPVYENLFLGRELKLGGNHSPFVNKAAMIQKSQALLDSMGVNVSPKARMGQLSVAQCQLVEIARAISMDASLIVLDEPTSAITDKEAEILFAQIRRLKAQGVSFIYISHKMDEVFRIADDITVLRDGHLVGEYAATSVDNEELITLMVDRPIDSLYPSRADGVPGAAAPLLEVKNVRNSLVHDVSFSIAPGEILGFAGLVGAGRSELAETIFGIIPKDSGTIKVDGREVQIRHPKDAVKMGIAFVTEDRKQTGLDLETSIEKNASIVALSSMAKLGFVERRTEFNRVKRETERLRVKAPSLKSPVAKLSGGNQQKVVIAKWLLSDPRIIILDEPTRGIDVGAKQEIYRIINELAAAGKAILLISSEMPELMGMADRIAVMCEGRIIDTLTKHDFDQEKILELASSFTAKVR